jgi:hypothetical protein
VDFFGLNLLQDRRPTYYGDIATEKPYYSLSSDFQHGEIEKKGANSNGSSEDDDHAYSVMDSVIRS